MATQYGRQRKEAPRIVYLVSPTNTVVQVTRDRAETLMQRAPVSMPDGSSRKYVETNAETYERYQKAREQRALGLEEDDAPEDKTPVKGKE